MPPKELVEARQIAEADRICNLRDRGVTAEQLMLRALYSRIEEVSPKRDADQLGKSSGKALFADAELASGG